MCARYDFNILSKLLLLLLLSCIFSVNVCGQGRKRSKHMAKHKTAGKQNRSRGGKGRPQAVTISSEKESRTLEQAKIDSQLLYALKLRRGEPLPFSDVESLKASIKVDNQGRTLVDVDATVSDELERQVRQFGGEIISSFKQYNAMRVNFPIEQLEKLAALKDIKFIRPAAVPSLDNASPTKGATERLDP